VFGHGKRLLASISVILTNNTQKINFLSFSRESEFNKFIKRSFEYLKILQIQFQIEILKMNLPEFDQLIVDTKKNPNKSKYSLEEIQ
jgi:hypothetical protein